VAATRLNLAIDRGSKYELTVQVNQNGAPLVLTGWTNALLTITENDPAGPLVLDTVAATINAAVGQVLVDLLYTKTASYTWSNASYKVEATDAVGQVRRLCQGSVTVSN
jgi:hypothetical protein